MWRGSIAGIRCSGSRIRLSRCSPCDSLRCGCGFPLIVACICSITSEFHVTRACHVTGPNVMWLNQLSYDFCWCHVTSPSVMWHLLMACDFTKCHVTSACVMSSVMWFLLMSCDHYSSHVTHHVTSPVIHQVPLNSELYVHRSGRTARAKREGLSLILIGPQEMMSYKNICKSLRRGCHAYSSHILVCDYVIMQRGSLRFQWIRGTCKPFVAESALLGDWRLPFTVETKYVHKKSCHLGQIEF